MVNETAVVEAPKPFDLKDLESMLKAKGMPALENGAHAVVEAVFEWIEKGVKLSDSKIDDFALAVLPPLKSFIDQKISEISN